MSEISQNQPSMVSSDGTEDSALVNRPSIDPWAITPDQKAYYLSQFLRLQPDPSGFLGGLKAKAFFELSKLPVRELSSIWELSDVDCDGQLTLSEFCVAMHLVVLRRNKVLLPATLPETLLREATSSALSTVNRIKNGTSTITSSLPRLSPEKSLKTTTSHVEFRRSRLYSSRGGEHRSFDKTCSQSDPSRTHFSHGDNDSTPRLRRWSTSSPSDIISPGITTFDSRLAPNAHIRHPIAIRAGAFQSKPQTHLRSASITTHLTCEETSPASTQGPRPPTPPPRSRVKATSADNSLEVCELSEPVLNRFSDSQTLSSSLSALKKECDQIVSENSHLTAELVMLQRRRIAFEILLERLTPLEA